MRRFGCTINRHFLKNVKENKIIEKRFFRTCSVLPQPCLQFERQTHREVIFCQQKREYVPNLNQEQCWNCNKDVDNRQSQMQCQHCGVLQDVRQDINYFDLMGFPKNFNLEIQALTKRFRQLQTVVHPDKFSNKSPREQSNSADWSSLINKAYKTLLPHLERGQYLIELKGIHMPQDNSALDKEFLMEMMERNEEVEDAMTKKELDNINQRLEKEFKEKIETLEISFNENNLDRAKTILVEMKYLRSIQNTVKNKLQKLLGN